MKWPPADVVRLSRILAHVLHGGLCWRWKQRLSLLRTLHLSRSNITVELGLRDGSDHISLYRVSIMEISMRSLKNSGIRTSRRFRSQWSLQGIDPGEVRGFKSLLNIYRTKTIPPWISILSFRKRFYQVECIILTGLEIYSSK